MTAVPGFLARLFRLQAAQELRYPVAFVTNLLAAAVFLALLAFAGRAVSGAHSPVPLLLGFMVMVSLQNPSRIVEDPAGAPEECMLSRWTLTGLMILETLARGLWMTLQLSLTFVLLLLPLGLEAQELRTFFQWAPLAWWVGLGPGLMLASATLLFKRTGALLNLVSLLVLGGAVLPVGAGWVGYVFPYVELLALVRGAPGSAGGAWIAATAWVLVGVLLLRAAERYGARHGLLGVR